MKLYYLCLIATLISLGALAQEEMPTVWSTRLDHKIQYSGTGDTSGVSFAASDKEMSVLDNETGKVVWTKAYKDIAPKLRKIDELIPFWESGCIFLFDRKLGKDQIAVIDLKTGQSLWTTDVYQNVGEENVCYVKERDGFAICNKEGMHFVKARTGEELWTTVAFKGSVGRYIATEDGNIIAVNILPTGLAALFSGFKSQIAKINMTNGSLVWDSEYVGIPERKVLTREFLYSLDVDQDRVYLRLNGMQVFDYKTGAKLWTAAFDFTPDRVKGAPMNAVKWGVYGAVADPVIVGDDMYVLDCASRKKQFIKKYDRKSGKLLWTSPEIPDARAIPNMYVVNDQVVLQIGGQVETQALLKSTSTDASGGTTVTYTSRIEYENVKPYGVKAFSTVDGSIKWESERFKKGITNLFPAGGNFYVCSGKALYSMDASGKELYEIPLGDDNIGNATMILPYKDQVAIIGEKGISTHALADGKLTNSGKYKSSTLRDQVGNIALMQTDKEDIAAFNLDNCKFLAYNARRDAMNSLTNDGQYVFVYEKKDVTKVKTH
jgi:outer membrane protein assembly factor BamB